MKYKSKQLNGAVKIGLDADCSKCKHQAPVAGSTHSMCVHSDAIQLGVAIDRGVMIELELMDEKTNEVATIPAMEYNQHGHSSGWFLYPFNFDPIWLRRCVLFET